MTPHKRLIQITLVLTFTVLLMVSSPVQASHNYRPNMASKGSPYLQTEGVESFPVGSNPNYSIWGGDNLFVANSMDQTVSVLDADGNLVTTIKISGTPVTLGWDGSRVWVADYGTDEKPGTSVFLFDASGKKAGTFKPGVRPYSFSYDADNARMWIALYGENKLVSLDAKGKILSTVETDTNPNTVLWNGTQLWATLWGDFGGEESTAGDTVIAVDTDSNITGTFTVGKGPADLAWDDTDKLLFVADYYENSVTALDAEGNEVGKYEVGNHPSALTWDGTHLWVALFDDKAVVALDKDGNILTTISVDAEPNGITYDGSTYVWVSDSGTSDQPGSTVTRIDPSAISDLQ